MAADQKTPTAKPKRRLGRGLSSLINDSAATQAAPQPPGRTPIKIPTQAAAEHHAPDGRQVELPIAQIAPNPYQLRRDFDADQLAELAATIAQQGILQPLLVAPADLSQGSLTHVVGGKPYTLIAGERRLRAAVKADLHTVPCVVRQANPRQMLEWAIIENIQRSDLNPIDRARGYRDYLDRFNLTATQAAERLGQPRATIANYLRLLDLCDDLQQMLVNSRLSFGHAKVLAGLAGRPAKQLALAAKVTAGALSVRQLEALVASEQQGRSAGAERSRQARAKEPYILDLEEQLTRAVGTRVTIATGRAKHTGRITIDFYSLDDFDRITHGLGLEVES